jgi:hypothetical protein
MPIRCQAFWQARRGNSPEQYEDAFAGDAVAGRFAVADGASESSFAGLWAKLLVEQFVGNPECDPDSWLEYLPALQKRWQSDVQARPLTWYGEAGLEDGSFATFLGIVLTAAPDGSHSWQALAVGDTCLFHTRDGALLGAFPVEQSDQFNSVPNLVGSRTPPEKIRDQGVLRGSGTALGNDRLWIMSDALAQWCLAENESGRNPWKEMESLTQSEAEAEQSVVSWIEELREIGRLQNDDVTLLGIDL